MRIIQVIGTSGAGKTRFIRNIIGDLARLGTVAVIKHIGHHSFHLEEEKDTTLFFTAGAAFSVGMDEEKTVIVEGETGLDAVLRQLCDGGADIALIEGFKSRIFPRIVIGDLDAENVVLRNPSTQDVIASLPRFPAIETGESLVLRLLKESGPGPVPYAFTVRIPEGDSRTQADAPAYAQDRLPVENAVKTIPGVVGVAIRRSDSLSGNETELVLAIVARDHRAGLLALQNVMEWLGNREHISA